MNKRFFSKVGEDIVTAFRHVMAYVFPMYCIRNKTLKSNPNAYDFLPSLKVQSKAICKLTVDELAERCWSAETLTEIFHQKHHYWFPMTDAEFYNLLNNKESMKKAMLHPRASFTDKQMRTLITNRGLEELISLKLKGLSEFVVSEVTGNKAYSEELLLKIMNIPEYNRVYQLWLERHKSVEIPESTIIKAIEYLFCTKVHVSIEHDESLSDVATLLSSPDMDNHAVWLSIALQNLDKESVFKIVVKYFSNILDYVEQCKGWKTEFLRILVKSPHCSFNLTCKAYELYVRNDDRFNVLDTMVKRANQLHEISVCFTILENYPEDMRLTYHKNLISKTLDRLEKVKGRLIARTSAASYLKAFLKYDGWTEDQKEVALRAMAAGESITEEDFEHLSDAEKEIVMNEWEIFAQFSMVSNHCDEVIKHKLQLLPEVEVYFLLNVINCYDHWREYVKMFELSDHTYNRIINCAYYANYEGLIIQHANKYGLTSWQYRQLMNSPLKYLAPRLKDKLKK